MAEPLEILETVISCFKITGEILFLILFWIYSYLFLFFRVLVPPPSKSLEGEIMLITGSSTGIGREVVLQLAQYHPKMTLVLWDWNDEENKKTVKEAKVFGATVYSYEIDISDREKVEELAKKVQAEVGDVTILYNNAGISQFGFFLETSPSDIEKTIQVNLISHFWTLRAFLPKMIEKNHGHIVTTASLGAYFGVKYSVPYFAAKYGIRGYLESLQDELLAHPKKPDNIKFTTVFPSFLKTPMTADKVEVDLKFSDNSRAVMDCKYLAKNIIAGIRQNQPKVMLPLASELLIIWKSFTPAKAYMKISRYFVDLVMLEKLPE